MAQLWWTLDYFVAHPAAALAALAGLAVVVYLLNQKPQYVRDADAQLRALRRESKYRDVR